jgi:hypothetical protein
MLVWHRGFRSIYCHFQTGSSLGRATTLVQSKETLCPRPTSGRERHHKATCSPCCNDIFTHVVSPAHRSKRSRPFGVACARSLSPSRAPAVRVLLPLAAMPHPFQPPVEWLSSPALTEPEGRSLFGCCLDGCSPVLLARGSRGIVSTCESERGGAHFAVCPVWAFPFASLLAALFTRLVPGGCVRPDWEALRFAELGALLARANPRAATLTLPSAPLGRPPPSGRRSHSPPYWRRSSHAWCAGAALGRTGKPCVSWN